MAREPEQESAKGKLLAKVREALLTDTPQPFPDVDPNTAFYAVQDEPLDLQFAAQFTALQGNFLFCEDTLECMQQLQQLADEKDWRHLFVWDHFLQELFIKNHFKKARIGRDLEKADAGVTRCEALVARTGSVLLSSQLAAGRSLPIYPPVHIVIAFTDQLVPDLPAALQLIKTKYEQRLPSMLYVASGPSRTADIEKTLVLGAHGPKEVFVFLIDKRG